MPIVSDNALDAALNYVRTNGDELHICTQEPTNYTQATSTYTAGNATGIAIGAPQNGDSSGRKIVVAAITDGDVTDTNTVTHWAITDGVSELLAAGTLTPSFGVVATSNFTLTAIDITVTDPA